MARRASTRAIVVLGALTWALPASAALPFDLEIGGFGSAFLPSKNHELYNPWVVGQSEMGAVAPGFGVRAAAVVPELYVGGEVELGFNFASVPDLGSATLMGWRAHAILGRMPAELMQAPASPFVVVGIGNLAVMSSDDVLGKDVDAAIHWGPGVIYKPISNLALRADLRHYISSKLGVVKQPSNHFEIQIGVSYVLGRDRGEEVEPEPVLVDSDGDGVTDDMDACKDVAGTGADGCPVDTDGDGLLDPDDSCPEEPETVNQVLDDDGCPDTIPDDLAMLVDGVPILDFKPGTDQFLEGTTFALDMAADVLMKHPGLRVRVIVYTRELADPIENFKLSTDRAYAIQAHFISLGIDGNRIEPEGSPVFEAGAYDDASIKTRVIVQVIE